MRKLWTLLCLIALPAAAHAPLLDTSAKTATAPLVLDQPEHSKVIFSELTGAPQHYQITSDRAFDFYVGVTAPKLEGCGLPETFSFDVMDAAGKLIDGREGDSLTWVPWFEEYGKNWYWVGPEIGKAFAHDRQYPAGTYTIKVFNKDNRGQYALAVGDQEKFGLGTMLTIDGTMKAVKEQFWDEGRCP